MSTFGRRRLDKIVANSDFHHCHHVNEADSCRQPKLAEPTKEAPQVRGKQCSTNVGPSAAVN